MKIRRWADHIQFATLVRYRDGELPADSAQSVAKHLASCQPCSLALHRLETAARLQRDLASLPNGLNPVPSAGGLSRLLQLVHQWEAMRRSPDLNRTIAATAVGEVTYYVGAHAASGLLVQSAAPDSPLLAHTETLLASFLGREAASAVASRIAEGAASELLARSKTRP